MTTRKSVTAALVLVFGLACAAAAQVQINIKRAQGKLKSIALVPGKGKARLVLKSQNWANTYAYTPKGKRLGLVDPFMYAATKETKGGKNVYINRPNLFATWVTKDFQHPNRPDAAVLCVGFTPPDGGLKKEIALTMAKGECMVYVYNRVTATQDLSILLERQCHYVMKPEKYRIYVDGKEVKADKSRTVRIQSCVLVYSPKQDASYALVFMPAKMQRHPHDGKSFGRIRFIITEKHHGADISWGKGGGAMKKGETRSQAYISVWGDGDLKAEVEAIAKKAKSGDLDKAVYILPNP